MASKWTFDQPTVCNRVAIPATEYEVRKIFAVMITERVVVTVNKNVIRALRILRIGWIVGYYLVLALARRFLIWMKLGYGSSQEQSEVVRKIVYIRIRAEGNMVLFLGHQIEKAGFTIALVEVANFLLVTLFKFSLVKDKSSCVCKKGIDMPVHRKGNKVEEST